ncbi:MAG: hypothetical protein WCJ30_11065, partial [Deltaproteobacteria bacterium]
MGNDARDNCHTMMIGDLGHCAAPAGDRKLALVRAREALEGSGLRSLGAHRIAWSDGYDTGVIDLADSPDAYAVIGRHSACDVVLANDPRVS